ncbi:1712_t:CDS:2, partial [Cetraspora pellucida]
MLEELKQNFCEIGNQNEDSLEDNSLVISLSSGFKEYIKPSNCKQDFLPGPT